MTKAKDSSSTATKPFRHLLRTRNICVLWMLRRLVHTSDVTTVSSPISGHPQLATTRKRLKIPATTNEEILEAVLQRLTVTLRVMESNKDQYRIPAALKANLHLLRTEYSFNTTECAVLAWAVLLRNDVDLNCVAASNKGCINPSKDLGKVLGLPTHKIASALNPASRLLRSGLVEVKEDCNFCNVVKLGHASLQQLAVAKFRSIDEFLTGYVRKAPPPVLAADDYSHLSPDFASLKRVLEDALTHGRTGVNILLHGAPGTGKTQLARVLAKALGVPLHEVEDRDNCIFAMSSAIRLSRAATALFLLGRRKALMCFDEVESIFNDGSALFGKPSTAEMKKSSFNTMMEQNGVPVIWIANRIHGIDPAFVRRFDLIINLETPPQKQRLALLERECGDLVSQRQLHRLARVPDLTPALVTRAASVVRRTGQNDCTASEQLLESILDNTLKAQRRPSLKVSLRNTDVGEFYPDLCNTEMDLATLANNLATSQSGRICLYGPPGTGKTAFGRWLADHLGMPLILKRVSDIQSPWLGEMERNLAEAFEIARRDGAILQFDEVDSFLQDRRNAQRPWEVSQVNEFLTQLEGFDGIFIASTNLMNNLDQAAMRRFDFKIRMDYLRAEQSRQLLRLKLDLWRVADNMSQEEMSQRLRPLKLTPGDFAVMSRRHRVTPFTDAAEVLNALGVEASMGERTARRPIGFV